MDTKSVHFKETDTLRSVVSGRLTKPLRATRCHPRATVETLSLGVRKGKIGKPPVVSLSPRNNEISFTKWLPELVKCGI